MLLSPLKPSCSSPQLLCLFCGLSVNANGVMQWLTSVSRACLQCCQTRTAFGRAGSPQNHLEAVQCGAASGEGNLWWSGSRGARAWMDKTRRGCLAAPVSSTCPARDEDAIKWPKLYIHFPLALHDFIFMLYIFISYIFILFLLAFCPLLPFHTKLPMGLPDSSSWQLCATWEFCLGKSWAPVSKLV